MTTGFARILKHPPVSCLLDHSTFLYFTNGLYSDSEDVYIKRLRSTESDTFQTIAWKQ